MSPARKRRRRSAPARSARGARTARRVAWDVLTAWHDRGVFANVVLDEICRKHNVAASERTLAMELSYSVIRRQATLDAVLKAFVDRPRGSVEPGLWTLLQIGACQVLLMDGIPPHAAVNETVSVAKQLKRPGWGGMVNAVMRTLAGAVSESGSALPAVDRIPIDAGRSRQLDRTVFPSPEKARVEYFVLAHSYPRWLMRDWLQRYGPDETTRLCFWFNTPHPPTLRVNRLQQSPEAVRHVLETAGVATHLGRRPESLHLARSVRVQDLPGFAEGWYSVQDESSMAAARLLDPQPGERILDLCAAPGGKATHLAELMKDQGELLAVDIDEERLQRAAENARRLKLTCIKCRTADPASESLPDKPFDRALVDVPCSNTGVLGKRPEARWRIDPEEFAELTELQERLLLRAADRVRPGGAVVYSTCSIDPRENRQVVDRALASRPDLVFIEELEHRPGLPGDGGYQALLRRGTAPDALKHHADESGFQ